MPEERRPTLSLPIWVHTLRSPALPFASCRRAEDAIRAMLDMDAAEAEDDNLFRIPAGTDFGIPLTDDDDDDDIGNGFDIEVEEAAAQRKAEEDAERAHARNESLREQTAAAAVAAEAAAAAEGERARREAMIANNTWNDRLSAADATAEDEVRRVTEKVSRVISWR